MNDMIEEYEIRGLPVCARGNVPVEGDIVVRLSGTRLRRGMLFECVSARAGDNSIDVRLLHKSQHPVIQEVERGLFLNKFAIYRRVSQLDEPL